MAGFLMNTEDATRLMAELQATHVRLVADAQRETIAAGRLMQATAREMARSKSMPHLAGSIGMKVKLNANGAEVTIEAADKLGYIREFGGGRSGPHPFAGPAAAQHMPGWEQKLAAALARTL